LANPDNNLAWNNNLLGQPGQQSGQQQLCSTITRTTYLANNPDNRDNNNPDNDEDFGQRQQQQPGQQ